LLEYPVRTVATVIDLPLSVTAVGANDLRVDLQVLTSETNYFAAELNLVQAQLNERLALVQLYQALGGGWRETNGQRYEAVLRISEAMAHCSEPESGRSDP
jgi:hypothetical protein